MAVELNISTKSNVDIQVSTTTANLQTANLQGSSKILTGDSVTVTSGAMTDLEKLVAQLKNESETVRQSVAQRRLSILQTVLDSLADSITAKEKELIIELEDLNAQKSEAEKDLADLQGEKTSTAGRIAVIDAEIKALENAVEREVQNGADHRERIAKLKELRATEQAKLDNIESAIKSTSAKIADLGVKISECTAEIGSTTLGEVAAALRAAATDDTPTLERAESDAEIRKREEKALETDIARQISESLDKIDEQILKALDETQVVKA